MSDEKVDAADAAKPGDATTGALPTSQAALEAGSQNIPAEGRTQIEVVDVRRGMFGAQGTGDTSGYGGLVTAIALPGPSERPYGGWFDEVVDILVEVLDQSGTTYAAAVESVVVDREELTLHIAREHLVEVSQVLRDDQDLRFELSLGVSGVHYPHDGGRELHAVYHLVSVTHSRRLRLEVAVPDSDPHLPSTVSVYPGTCDGFVGCWVVDGCCAVVGGCGVDGCCDVLDCDACGAANSGVAANATRTAARKRPRQASFIHAPLMSRPRPPGTESTCARAR